MVDLDVDKLMEKEIGGIKETLARIEANQLNQAELIRFKHNEQKDKNKVIFDFVNKTNETMGMMQEGLTNVHDYTQSVSKDLKSHVGNHFSWLKISGVAVAALSGLAALFDRAMGWGK